MLRGSVFKLVEIPTDQQIRVQWKKSNKNKEIGRVLEEQEGP